ncbi:hypothetical protein [Actinophytocola sp.]|uniref:hypothetical protein n=1 Tax=Actinophytocola sp. TaxID=1872138 RepID=UPI002DBE1ADA|nr:hypothetical protein [Actinophytocola sp.]
MHRAALRQPITRILAITFDDITHTDTDVVLRLGDPPSPVPEPFAGLLLQLVDQRTRAGGDRWLFSGRSIGQPMSDRGLARRLRDLGIPLRLARVAALRQLVLEVPAPVAAHALGFHHTTTPRQTTTQAVLGTATSQQDPEQRNVQA